MQNAHGNELSSRSVIFENKQFFISFHHRINFFSRLGSDCTFVLIHFIYAYIIKVWLIFLSQVYNKYSVGQGELTTTNNLL